MLVAMSTRVNVRKSRRRATNSLAVPAEILDSPCRYDNQLNTAIALITRNQSVLADRIAVLYRGELVEEGTGAEVLGTPKHPYTKRLLASLPVPNPAQQAIRREELRMLRAGD